MYNALYTMYRARVPACVPADMIHEGVILKGRHLAIQHGAGRVIVDFWRDAMHLYNLLGKVSGEILDLDIISDVTKIATV